MAGMAIGTAALILIVSVYNGFDRIIKDNLSDLDPDYLIVPAEGKYFIPSEELIESLSEYGRVERIIEDNVFFNYGDAQGIARAKGVSESYLEFSGLPSHIIEGELKLEFGDLNFASLGSGIAYGNGIHPRFVEPMFIYYPNRDGHFSATNPTASLKCERVSPGSIFSISADTDNELIILPYRTMQNLMQYGEEVSALELRISSASKVKASRISEAAGSALTVKDRYQQHPALFKMMRYEKAAVFLILLFVVIIVAFNIFGSLSLLIIEKKEDIAILKAMGADDSSVRKVFVLEGWLISITGLLIGLAAGIGLTLLQQHFGIVKLPGNYLINAYPVDLQFADVAIAAAGVALIGLVIARLSART